MAEEPPLKDYGSFVNFQPNEDAIAEHHRERWQDQAMYIGLRYPRDVRKRRHHGHRQKSHARGSSSTEPQVVKPVTTALVPVSVLKKDIKLDFIGETVTPPAQRVQFLLGSDDCDDEDHQAHDMFCEMEELRMVGEDGDREWKEIARWIKFEEDVEEGGERWSKPHVATLSLHSLFELRRGITNGTILLDANAVTIFQLSELILDSMIASGQLDTENRQTVQDVLLSRHRHQHQRKGEGVKGLPMIRSLADIGHRNSDRKMENKEALARANQSTGFLPSMARRGSSKDLPAPGEVPRNASSTDMSEVSSSHKFNEHFLKKIPQGAEASNILIGELECLKDSLVIFVRLQKAVLFADLTEVSVPTRFIFIQLGPVGHQQRYHEIGRSMATLMSDEIFHDVAYKARDRNDLLAGLDEFLDCVMVLPPGEWDPTIRIEPPKQVPSQEKRKKPDLPPNGGYMSPINEEAPSTPRTNGGPPGNVSSGKEEESHVDATLNRTGRLFGGLIADVKRRAPWYLSDFKDALHVQCIASFFFMYFACLTPIITFGGLLGAATGRNIAAMESLVSGAVCGITYHLFAGQPLTIVGSTGPVLVFETIVFKFCTDQGLNYLCFRFWVGMWICVCLMFIVAFDLSALVRYITRFTEESFAMLIAIIFIVEAFSKLLHILDKFPVNLHPDLPLDYNCTCVPFSMAWNASNMTEWTTVYHTTPTFETSDWDSFNSTRPTPLDWAIMDKEACARNNGSLVGTGCNTPHYVPNVFMVSCLLFLGTFVVSMSLKIFRNTRFFPNQARVIVSDFAVCIAILLMVVADLLIGLKTPKLEVPPEFRPTLPGRGWIVNPFANSWFWVFAGVPPALLGTILIFMDQQITAVIVNRKENKLLKGSGYHLDLFVVTLQIGICSIIGTPWFVAATVLSINHIRSLTRESESSAPGERPKFLGVREQRVTGVVVFTMVGLSALMADVLKYIPMPVLYGVFLFMGVASLKGIQCVQRVLIMLMPTKYQPDYMYLRHVPVRRVHLFTGIQVLCLSGLWVVKSIKQISIVFPIMVLAMCFIRKGLDWVFTRHELKWLDDIMPESHKREKEDKKKNLNSGDNEEGGEHVVEIGEANKADIPLKPMASHQSYVSQDVNISEEMSKTGIWHHLNSQPRFQTSQPANAEAVTKTRNEKSTGDYEKEMLKKDPAVKFQIAEDEDDDAGETNALVKAQAGTGQSKTNIV